MRNQNNRPSPFWLRVLVFVLVPFCSLSAFAAQQGSVGPTSSGNIDITYTQGLNVRISGMNDISLGTWSGTGDLAGDDNICIGRSGVGFFGSGTYRILASGDGAPGNPAAFTLSNGVNTLTYEAYFNDQTGIVNRQPLTPGVALTNQSSGGFVFVFNLLFGCVFQNANISIVVPEAELNTGAGNYTGTLSLLLIPE